jgi:hypothetical protein
MEMYFKLYVIFDNFFCVSLLLFAMNGEESKKEIAHAKEVFYDADQVVIIVNIV